MRVEPFEMPVEDIKRSLNWLRRPLHVAILRARNPFNVGSIIRVAHSFLAKEVLLVGNERYYKRGAMGMDRYETIVELADEAALVAHARQRGLPLVVFEREHAEADLWRTRLPEACVMVFGSETDGVSKTLIEAADHVVAIPMYGINNSFPVTVAAGIAMAEWTRQHHLHG